MHNACGLPVLGSGTSRYSFTNLYSALAPTHQLPEYKSSTYALLYTQVVRELSHYFIAHLTTVNNRLMPTIHCTNKNIKKFFIHNLLLITRKAV